MCVLTGKSKIDMSADGVAINEEVSSEEDYPNRSRHRWSSWGGITCESGLCVTAGTDSFVWMRTDDGNLDDGDGCSSACDVESFGSG